MAALRPRITRIAGSNVQQARQLHMTGPSTFPTPLISSERSAIKGIPRDLMSLRAECKSKNLPTTGSKAELTARLTAAAVTPAPTSSGRHFNTSRSMKAVNDSSTIDFAYIPDFDPDTEENPVFIGVPRIDSSALRSRTGGVGAAEEIEDAVTRHEVHIPEGSASHVLPATALYHSINIPVDNTQTTSDPELDMVAVASRIADAARRNLDPNAPASESVAGSAKKVWSGFLDDLLGEKKNLA